MIFVSLLSTWRPWTSAVVTLGGILTLCEAPEGFYGLENVTTASIDLAVISK